MSGMDLRRIPAACFVLVLLAAGACGSTGTGAPTTNLTPQPVPAVVFHASEPDNGASVAVRMGARVTVVLHSTYWTIDPPKPSGVLRTTTGPVVVPKIGGCVRGQGCGTVTMEFVAAGHGTTTVAAQRTSCGEAMLCASTESTWQVVVRVP